MRKKFLISILLLTVFVSCDERDWYPLENFKVNEKLETFFKAITNFDSLKFVCNNESIILKNETIEKKLYNTFGGFGLNRKAQLLYECHLKMDSNFTREKDDDYIFLSVDPAILSTQLTVFIQDFYYTFTNTLPILINDKKNEFMPTRYFLLNNKSSFILKPKSIVKMYISYEKGIFAVETLDKRLWKVQKSY